jgi:hypothetical protein
MSDIGAISKNAPKLVDDRTRERKILIGCGKLCDIFQVRALFR